MSTEDEEKVDAEIDGSDDLQFDQADLDGARAAAACAACGIGIEESYYEVNGNILCATCSDQIQTALDSSSPLPRVIKAAIFGFVGAAVGAGIYYAILALTGYEIGLVALGVAYIVGIAVRTGSENRGGLVYQLLAVALTYGAICSTYVPFMVQGIRAERTQMEAAAATVGDNDGAAATTVSEEAEPRIVMKMVGYFVLFIFSLGIPFMQGFNNIIGLLIIGFAVYWAWAINRRTPLVISGPYRVGDDLDGDSAAINV